MRESVTGSIARYDLDALSPVATQVATAPIHALDAAAGLIAQGEDNGRVTIRDGRTLRQIGEKLTLGPYRSRDRGPGMASARQVTALALTPNGSAIIAADQVGHLRMWSLPGRELLWSRDDVPTSWLAISPDGRYLATVGNTYKGGVPDGAPVTSAVTVWNLSTHAVRLSEDLTANQYRDPGIDHTEPITPRLRAVAFSPDGSKVAVANSDFQGFVRIYDLALRRRTLPLTMFKNPPSSVAFSPDSQRLLAASTDTLWEWDATTGEVLHRWLIPVLRDFTRMTYTEDGRWLVISHPRSLSVLDAQTLGVAIADLPLPTEAPADALAIAAGQEHQLLVGTPSVLASIEMDPEQWKSAACQVAARNPKNELTKEQWNRFLPAIPYSPACR